MCGVKRYQLLAQENVALSFESADEIQWCDHLTETSLVVLSRGTIYLGL